MHGNNIPVNGPLLLEELTNLGNLITGAFDYKSFQTSNGWLRGWKERYVQTISLYVKIHNKESGLHIREILPMIRYYLLN